MTTILKREDREALDLNGFVILPKTIQGNVLSDAQAAAQRMIHKVEKGEYWLFRIYDDLLKLNIAGIERLFHPEIFQYDLFRAVVSSHVLEIAKEILETESPSMLLNRMHVTTKYSHTGIWHRDATPGDEDHIQVSLYLYPEDRFFIVPMSHRRKDTDEEKVLLGKSVKADLPGQIKVSVGAGDLLFFRSALLHRASCVGTRANVHFRFGKEPANTDARCGYQWNIASPAWKTLLEDPATNCDFYPEDHPPKRLWFPKRVIATVLHYALAHLPESHRIFERFRWITPNLRLRRNQ